MWSIKACNLDGFTPIHNFTYSSLTMDLHSNTFWVKKLRKAFETQDVDKNGFISRADFDLVVSRYKEMGSSEEHTKILQDHFNKFCDIWGLNDYTVKLTVDEMIEIYGKQLQKPDKPKSIFNELFDSVDMNGNAHFQEWQTHYKAMGIPIEHARASFDAMDANGDGKVSKEEFSDYHREYFRSTEDKLNSSILYGPLNNF